MGDLACPDCGETVRGASDLVSVSSFIHQNTAGRCPARKECPRCRGLYILIERDGQKVFPAHGDGVTKPRAWCRMSGQPLGDAELPENDPIHSGVSE